MTQDERRTATYLLAEIAHGLKPDATGAWAAHTLLTKLVTEAHGASSHAPRRRRRAAAHTPEPAATA